MKSPDQRLIGNDGYQRTRLEPYILVHQLFELGRAFLIREEQDTEYIRNEKYVYCIFDGIYINLHRVIGREV